MSFLPSSRSQTGRSFLDFNDLYMNTKHSQPENIFTSGHSLLRKAEAFVFFLIFAYTLYIVFFKYHYLVPIDGPAHLYDSRLLWELIKGENLIIKDFFKINPYPVPNWTTYGLLMVLHFFFPGFLVEKIFIGIYVFLFVFGFRYLIKQQAPSNMWLSHLSFPFAFSFLFLASGLYSYSLGIALFFWIFGYFIQVRKQKNKRLIFLTFLFVLLYFTHFFAYSLLLLGSGTYLLWEILSAKWQKRKKLQEIWQKEKNFILLLIVAGIIWSGFFIFYKNIDPLHGKPYKLQSPKWLPMHQLISDIIRIRPLFVFHEGKEAVNIARISVIIWALASVAFYVTLNPLLGSSLKNVAKKIKELISPKYAPLVLMFGIFGIYFIFPDFNGRDGYGSVRFLTAAFLFLLLFISSAKISEWFQILTMFFLLHQHFYLLHSKLSTVENLNRKIIKMRKNVVPLIKENSVVLPIRTYNDWLTKHVSNALGADKPMIILDASTPWAGHYPVIWNLKNIPGIRLGNTEAQKFKCLDLIPRTDTVFVNKSRQINYVFVVGDFEKVQKDTCFQKVKREIDSLFVRIYKDSYCELYEYRDP